MQEKLHPKLKAVLESEGKLGKYSFAPGKTGQLLDLTHNQTVLSLLIWPDEEQRRFLIRRESFLIDYYSSDKRLEDLAISYGTSRETLRKNIGAGLIDRLKYLSPELRANFQPEDLWPLGKKLYPPEYLLLIKDHLGSEIVELLDQNMEVPEMVKILEIPKENLIPRLRLLRDLGFNIPRIYNSPLENIRLLDELSDQSKTDKEVLDLLSNLTTASYEQGLRRGILKAITKMARKAGFHASQKHISALLRAAEAGGVPFYPIEHQVYTGPQQGIQRRFVGVSWHQDRLKEALKTSKSTKRLLINPVKRVSGKDKTPTTWEIRTRKGVQSVAKAVLDDFDLLPQTRVFNEIKVVLKNNGYTGNLFKYRDSLYLRDADKPVLDQYLEESFGLVRKIPAK